MDRVFFSVIVPVYNVRDYLEECVESVKKQTFQSWELILVDDGSTDGSGELCDALALSDGRIRVLHQKNQGLSGARNSGFAMSEGTYVIFLDSDDFYPQPFFLERLAETSDDRDIICFNYARFTDHLQEPMMAYPSGDTPQEELRLALVKNNAYTSSACFKAIRRELLRKENITFQPGILSEDIEWSGKVLRCARSVAMAPECMYAYRVRPGSITRTMSLNHVQDLCTIVENLSKTEVEPELKDAYLSYTAFQYATLMINIHLCKAKIDKSTMKTIRSLAWLLRYDANRIVRLVHTAYRFTGFTITSWLLYIYFKLFYW